MRKTDANGCRMIYEVLNGTYINEDHKACQPAVSTLRPTLHPMTIQQSPASYADIDSWKHTVSESAEV